MVKVHQIYHPRGNRRRVHRRRFGHRGRGLAHRLGRLCRSSCVCVCAACVRSARVSGTRGAFRGVALKKVPTEAR